MEGLYTKLKINTTLVYRYEREDDRIKIKLDTLTIFIKKIIIAIEDVDNWHSL